MLKNAKSSIIFTLKLINNTTVADIVALTNIKLSVLMQIEQINTVY